MATIHTFHLPDPMHTDEWWEYDSPQLPIPNISSYSELSGALVQPVPATVQISPHFQDLVKQSEAPQPHPATYGAFGMTGSTFFPRIPPNVEEHGIIFGTTFEAPRSPKPPVPGTSPPQVPRPGFFGICFVSDQIYPASDTVTMGGPHLGLRSESPHRHLSRTPQGTHSYLQDDRIENPDLCPLERSWKEVDNAFYHGHTDVQPPLSPGSVLPEMGSELSHSQPRSRSESISGQSDDHDHPPMSPDYEDISDDNISDDNISDDNISDDNISDDNISDDTSDDMSDDEPTLPGSVDQYTHDNHNGTWMCTWPDGSKPSGVCEFISTCPLVKRHIKRMHYRERPFPCEHPNCDYSFFTKFGRNVHHNSHTGARPFKCVSCGKGFGSPSGCSHHRINVHGVWLRKSRKRRTRKKGKVSRQIRPRPARSSFRGVR